MARSKKRYSEQLPIRSPSHLKEDESKEILQKIIKPWMIASWMDRDYGIDGMVEIMRRDPNSENYYNTGKRFSVQVKSTTEIDCSKEVIPFGSVPIEKINYWLRAIEPVLIVLIDLKTEKCFYRWIDEEFRSELFEKNASWIAQKSTTIYFKSHLFIDNDNLSDLERYIFNYKRPIKTVLAPGKYFKYGEDIRTYFESLSAATKKHKIPYLQSELQASSKSSKNAVYTIAVVGPSRVGKSTLINSLLRTDVSPVGVLPTTGIPITIYPGDKNISEIQFKNGDKKRGGVDSAFLKEFTSQDFNPDNVKQVKLVSVNIMNYQLERGIALCDVPGLDDPDDTIRNITVAAVNNVNAIIYVIDASPYRTGSFSITRHHIHDLNELAVRMDRVFLVFNKIDELSTQQVTELKEYVAKILDKHKISPYLPFPPLFISAKNSFERRVNQSDTSDDVGILENHFWDYLLNNNLTGLQKLSSNYSSALEFCDKLTNIINAGLISAEKRKELDAEISLIKNEIEQIGNIIPEKKSIIYNWLDQFVTDRFNHIIAYLKQDLEGRSLQEHLPAAKDIADWLSNNAYRGINEAHLEMDKHINQLQTDLNHWILTKLKQVDINSDSQGSTAKTFNVDIMQYTSQITDNFNDEQLDHPGIIEKVLIKTVQLITAVIELLRDIFYSEETKRKTAITGIVKKSGRWYNNIKVQLMMDIDSYLNGICEYIAERSYDRARVYLGVLQKQLLELPTPVAEAERENLQVFLSTVNQIRKDMSSNFIQLRSYTADIA
jgi:GTPase SAR1 family protein